MADYVDLIEIFSNDALRGKIKVACTVAADTVRAEDVGTANHANRLLWAREVFRTPDAAAEEMLPAVLAANHTATVNNITGASDTAIQTNVVDAIDMFAGT